MSESPARLTAPTLCVASPAWLLISRAHLPSHVHPSRPRRRLALHPRSAIFLSDIGVTFVGDGAGGDSGDATADDDDRARCMLSRAASMRERTSRCSRIF